MFLMIMFGLASYLTSFLKGKISKDLFTISQSLAFGNKPVMVSILTISFMLILYLNYYRGHKYLLVRMFLLLLMYSLIITIIWVTTYYNIKDHYILAFVIFTLALIYVYLNSIVIYKGLKNKTRINIFILFLIPILITLGFLGLIISNISPIRKEVVELFPSFENFTLSIMGLSILALGFI
jgi:hypothetical protein